MFAAQVPSITLNSPNLGEFPRVFLDDDRTYSDYIKLDELGNLGNFTRTFADFSEAKLANHPGNYADYLRIADYIDFLNFR